MRMWVRSLASLSGLKDLASVGCGVCRRCDLDPPLLWLWCMPTAAAPIQPLAWGLPYASRVALKRKRKRKKKKNISIYMYTHTYIHIVDLQCVQFLLYSKVTQSYIYIHSFSQTIFHHVLSQEMIQFPVLCGRKGCDFKMNLAPTPLVRTPPSWESQGNCVEAKGFLFKHQVQPSGG